MISEVHVVSYGDMCTRTLLHRRDIIKVCQATVIGHFHSSFRVKCNLMSLRTHRNMKIRYTVTKFNIFLSLPKVVMAKKAQSILRKTIGQTGRKGTQ